jgi:outer membrane protein assembly factor BamB
VNLFLHRSGLVFTALITAATGPQAQDWPQFRGASGSGVAPNALVPAHWSSTSNLAWKLPLQGSGWSQPIVLHGTVYFTGAVSRQSLRPKIFAEGLTDPHTLAGASQDAPDLTITWKLSAADLADGKLRWERAIVSSAPRYPIHPSNTFASETPAADERGVYVYFGTAGMVAAVDHQGAPLWTRTLGPFRQQENYGTGSSLRLRAGLLYLQCFSAEEAFLVCLDTQDGSERWRVGRDQPGSCWNTPLLWDTAQRTELIVYGQRLLTSHDPRTGNELWRAEGVQMPAMTSACADTERLYFGCRDPYRGGPLHALRAPLRDRLRLSEVAPALGEAWIAPGAAPGMPSLLTAEGCVYVINGTILACHDRVTGQEHFKERLPECRAVIASPVAAGRTIIIVDESGVGLALAAGARFEILGRSRLDDIFWASPAIAGNDLVLRGLAYLYCIRQQ